MKWECQQDDTQCTLSCLCIVESWYNEPLFNDVLGITNDFLYPCDDKICEKEPRDNETSLYRTNFANPLAPRYTEVPLYKETPRRNF